MSGILSGWNLLPAVPAALDTAISRAVKKAAFDIQAHAQANAPVDFGALKASIYVKTKDNSGYDAAATAATGANPKVDILDELPAPPNDRTAYVAVGVNYGIFVELGTRFAPAQPYLLPAAELVKPQYLAALKGLNGVLLSLLGAGGSVNTTIVEE